VKKHHLGGKKNPKGRSRSTKIIAPTKKDGFKSTTGESVKIRGWLKKEKIKETKGPRTYNVQ